MDAGNWFDAYGLGKVARAAQLDERRVLVHVRVARPFTAIQMTRMLARQVPLIAPETPIILSDPMALFYDHEMPEDEVSRIFREFLIVVRELTVPVLTLAVMREAPPRRRDLSRRLLHEARAVARLDAAPDTPRLA
jgi:hypothetical protein